MTDNTLFEKHTEPLSEGLDMFYCGKGIKIKNYVYGTGNTFAFSDYTEFLRLYSEGVILRLCLNTRRKCSFVL